MSSKSFLGAGALSPCCHTDAYSTGTILLFCSEIPSKYSFSGSVAHNSQYGAPDLRSAFTNSLKGRALPSIKERNGVSSFVARRRKSSKKKAFKLHASNEALRQEDSVTCKLENLSDSSDGIVAGSSDVLISLSEKIATECLYDTLSVGEFNNSHSGSIPRQLTIFEDPFLTHGWSPEDKPKSSLESEAWELLRSSIVNYCGNPVGTIAANDPGDTDPVNYDQVFIRDFIPSAMAFLLNGESEIVRNFILHTLQLQSWEKSVDCHSPGQGLMPASFKIRTLPLDGDSTEDVLDADFGEAAIGRVAPVDSGLWWIILLRAYGKCTGDLSLQERVDVQTGIKLILKLCLSDGFDMFPTLLVTDGSCMIDRRMGIHGHPLEIQALFYSALQCAKELLTLGDGAEGLMKAVNSRLYALSFHIREYYWVDLSRLNEIYRYKTEEYSHDAVNKFNIYPDQIPSWLVDWMPQHGGYFIGNLQPAHMDFRFFSLGNLWSIVTSLTTQKQAEAILDLIESRWDDLIASMPLKICYPALEREEWRIITGSDPKNTPWSYHNGGSWPTLIWQFTAACIKMGRSDLAARAVSILESRISKDRWPEYYDTRKARFIGKQAKLYQTWSIAGYLVAKQLLKNPEAINFFACEDNSNLLEGLFCNLEESPRRNRRKGATIQV